MIYIGAYLLIGMLYAGLKFKKIFAICFTEDEIKEISNKQKGEYTTEDTIKFFVALVLTLIISVINVLAWPFTMIVARKPKRKGEKS